jgi:hypothetical protein
MLSLGDAIKFSILNCLDCPITPPKFDVFVGVNPTPPLPLGFYYDPTIELLNYFIFY